MLSQPLQPKDRNLIAPWLKLGAKTEQAKRSKPVKLSDLTTKCQQTKKNHLFILLMVKGHNLHTPNLKATLWHQMNIEPDLDLYHPSDFIRPPNFRRTKDAAQANTQHTSSGVKAQFNSEGDGNGPSHRKTHDLRTVYGVELLGQGDLHATAPLRASVSAQARAA